MNGEQDNLLNNIELVIATLKSETLSNQGAKRLEILENEAIRVKRFISDFLQFAKKPALRTQKVSLAPTIKETIHIHEAQAKARGVDLKQSLPSITVDRQMIYQAISNLLKNSLEAIETNGTIKISWQANGQELILAIEDNGPGIGPPVLEKLFEPFFTTKGRKGTGLGLSIVQGIVQAYNGTICCQSEPDKGTRFLIQFPLI